MNYARICKQLLSGKIDKLRAISDLAITYDNKQLARHVVELIQVVAQQNQLIDAWAVHVQTPQLDQSAVIHEIDTLLTTKIIDETTAYWLYRATTGSSTKSQNHLLKILRCNKIKATQDANDMQDADDVTPFGYDPGDATYPNCHLDCEYCDNLVCAMRGQKSLICVVSCNKCLVRECTQRSPF